MKRFLVGIFQYDCTFRVSHDSRCKELRQLSQHIPEEEESTEVTALQALIAKQPIGRAYNSEKILLLPMVFIDGARSMVKPDQPEGGWACFWRKGSIHKASGSCQFPPFTNNRAEMEALLHCIHIHKTMKNADLPWIVVSDSAYLCDGINLHRRNWQKHFLPAEDRKTIVNQQGVEVSNCDLWVKVFE